VFKNYLKTAIRNLWKNKAFSALNIFGLAIGLTCCILLLLYANYHFSWNKQFDNIENIYVTESNQYADNNVFTYQVSPRPLAGAIQEQVPGVVRAVRVVSYFAGGLMSYEDNIFRGNGLHADSTFFEMFHFPFIYGNAKTALSKPDDIVITQSFAKKLFGNDNPMGKIITRNDTMPLVVSAVVADPFVNADLQFEYVMPWHIVEEEQPWIKTSGWASNFTDTYVQLKSTNDFKRADGIIRKMINANQDNYKAEAFLFPLYKNHLYREFKDGKPTGSGMISQVNLFIGLALAILLIACINFMNLSTARSQKKAKEVGILKTIGSGRTSLVFRFLTESYLITALAMLLSLIILTLCLPYFNNLLNVNIKSPLQESWFWAGIIVIGLFTGLVAGSYPAFYLSSFKPVKVLKGIVSKGSSVITVRKATVVMQFATAMFLMVATFCIYKQVNFIRNKPIGYNKDNLVEIKVEGNLGKNKEILMNDLYKQNIITAATGTSISITQGGNNGWGFSWPGKQVNEKVLIDYLSVGYNFQKTFDSDLLDGRDFSNNYPSDTSGLNILISETAMKVMKLKTPLGTIITDGDGIKYTVVGVFKDIIKGSLYYKVNPMIVFYENNPQYLSLRLNPSKNISSSLQKMKAELKKLNPSFPPDIAFVADNVAEKYKNEQVLGAIANIFGGLAIFLSCLGLLGLSAFAAEQRTKEIGVRKILGANVWKLTALLSGEFLLLVLISFVVATPVSWWAMNKWLDKFDYHTTLSFWVFVLAGLSVLLISLITVGIQGIKAAMANPVKSLRTE